MSVCSLLILLQKLFYHIFDSGINVVLSKQYNPLPIEPGVLFYQNDFLIHRCKEQY